VTQRGLIIGTSHTAALRLAWKAGQQDLPEIDLDFAALQGSVDDLTVQDGHLMAKSDDARDRLHATSGRTHFALNDYAFIAVCGGVSGAFSAIRLYQQARWCDLPSVASGGTHLKPTESLISAACFATALTTMIRAGAAWPLLNALHQTANLPVFAIAEPLLSFVALTDKTRFHGFRILHRNGDAHALAAMLETACHSACAGVAHYIPPPNAVRKGGFFTRPDLRRGATRLGAGDDVPQPHHDFLHGNAAYGRHILKALLAALRQTAPLS
jgi:hypothetical protein